MRGPVSERWPKGMQRLIFPIERIRARMHVGAALRGCPNVWHEKNLKCLPKPEGLECQ